MPRRHAPHPLVSRLLLPCCLLSSALLVGCNSRSIGDLAGRIWVRPADDETLQALPRAATDPAALRTAGDAPAERLTSVPSPLCATAPVARDSRSDAVRRQCLADLRQHRPYPFDFNLTSLTGQRLTLSQFAGRVLIVDIWGTWCPPCRGEIPHFVQLHQRYGASDLAIVGINYERAGSDRQALQQIDAFRRQQPIPYPLALGTESLQDQIPGFRAFPTTLMIDRTGRVRATLVGARSLEFLETMAGLLMDESDGATSRGIAAADARAPSTPRAGVDPDAPPAPPRIQFNPFAADIDR